MKHSRDCCPDGHHDHRPFVPGGIVRNLVDTQLALGGSLIGIPLAVGRGLWDIAAGLSAGAIGAVSEFGDRVFPRNSCCDIPPACWMPIGHGELCCELGVGGHGQIWLHVTNEDYRPHVYTAKAAGPDAALFTFSPAQVTLGPKERTVITCTFDLPPSQPTKRLIEAVIWVLGCRNHFVRWRIDTCGKHRHCCHDVCIEDCPDYIVHWYDHFYCRRPCPGPLTMPK